MTRSKQDQEEIELIEGFTYPLPVRIISDIMGPAVDENKIGRWSMNIVFTLLDYYYVKDRYERTERSVREFSA